MDVYLLEKKDIGILNLINLGQQVQPVSRFEQHVTSESVQRIPQPQQHVTSLEEFEQRQQIHRQQQVFSTFNKFHTTFYKTT